LEITAAEGDVVRVAGLDVEPAEVEVSGASEIHRGAERVVRLGEVRDRRDAVFLRLDAQLRAADGLGGEKITDPTTGETGGAIHVALPEVDGTCVSIPTASTSAK
jgi:hypothetical protein